MKAKDLKEMTNDELDNKLKALKSELFNLRFSHATGQLANPMQINNTKKDIARVLTIMKQRQSQNSSNN